MKPTISLIAFAATAFFATLAVAQPGPGPTAGGGPRPLDCVRTPDPARCEEDRKAHLAARQEAANRCKGLKGDAHRRCVRDGAIARQDCARTSNPSRCAAVRSAYEQCKTKVGPQFSACMDASLPPSDCTKARNPEHCQAKEIARQACKGTAPGPERRACIATALKKK